jgi:cytochrome c-type biogenesis protein CcmH/NrfG
MTVEDDVLAFVYPLLQAVITDAFLLILEKAATAGSLLLHILQSQGRNAKLEQAVQELSPARDKLRETARELIRVLPNEISLQVKERHDKLETILTAVSQAVASVPEFKLILIGTILVQFVCIAAALNNEMNSRPKSTCFVPFPMA